MTNDGFLLTPITINTIASKVRGMTRYETITPFSLPYGIDSVALSYIALLCDLYFESVFLLSIVHWYFSKWWTRLCSYPKL